MKATNSTIQANHIRRLMIDKFVSLGLNEDDASVIALHLTETSLDGTDTHGIRLFPTYVKEFEGGRSNPKPRIKVEKESAVSALIDAGGANGIIAAEYAIKIAIDKAKREGLSAIVVKNSNHFGAAINYSKQAAKEGLIAISLTNSDALVSLAGGKEPLLGTNPIGFSAPAHEHAFHSDFATSQVSYSKVKHWQEVGAEIPVGCARDESGEESAQSQKVSSLQALGGYKGQGLGFMVQILTAVLGGAPFDHELSHLYSEPYDKPREVAHFFLVINPSLFGHSQEFKSRVDGLISEARAHSPLATLPGEIESQTKKSRLSEGIPIEPEFKAWLDELEAPITS